MIGPNRIETRLAATALVALMTTAAIGNAVVRAADDKPATKTREVEAAKLKLKVPEDWKQSEEKRQFRAAQFAVPPQGEDKENGEFVVFDFGAQGAGSLEANVQRWVGQVEADGRKVKTVTGESASGKYTLVDISGTYKKAIGPPIAQQTKAMPNWRVINVELQTKDGIYYLKLDGPAKTIAGLEDDLRTTFGAKKDGEKDAKAQ